MFRRKSFYLLLFLLLLLFSIPIIEYFTDWSPSNTLVQVVGFALTLIGIFGGAYFELNRLQEQAKQERQKENRQHRLATLTEIEKWVDDFAYTVEEIGALVELSPMDKTGSKLIVGKEKTTPVVEKLFRLDYRWMTIFAKTTDLIGIKKDETKLDELDDEKSSLLQNIYAIGVGLENIRETFAKGNKIPRVEDYRHPITDAKRAIDKIRLKIE